MILGFLHPVRQFCEYFSERTVNVTDIQNGDVKAVSWKDESIVFYMQMSADHSDADLLETLPLCIAHMLANPEDDTDAPYAFSGYCSGFARTRHELNITQADIERVCREQTPQLPHMLNAILQMRLIGDDDGTIAIAVGTLKGALSGIRYESHWAQN